MIEIQASGWQTMPCREFSVDCDNQKSNPTSCSDMLGESGLLTHAVCLINTGLRTINDEILFKQLVLVLTIAVELIYQLSIYAQNKPIIYVPHSFFLQRDIKIKCYRAKNKTVLSFQGLMYLALPNLKMTEIGHIFKL